MQIINFMFQKKVKDKLSQYTDPTGEFSNRELKLAEWYIAHKLKLRKIGLGALMAWGVLTVGYSLGYFGYYLAIGYSQDQRMMVSQTLEIENYDSLKHFYAPKPLVVNKVDVYQTISRESYDFVADITNPNESWLAGVEYQFVFEGGETAMAQTVVLPGANRPLAFFGFKSADYPSNARLVIKNVTWRNLDKHLYPNLKGYQAERNIWQIDNFKFTRASRLTGNPSHRLEFALSNYSPYSFWKVNFYVELFNEEERIGLIFLPEEKFRSQETRQVDVRSFIDDLQVTEVKIYPVVNIFDPEEYLPAGED